MDEQTTPAVIAGRIAAAHAARAPVDSNGKRIGKATTYTYDAAGRLIRADVPADE